MIIHHAIVNLQSMSLIPGRSSGCFGDTGFEIVGVRDTKDNLEKVLGEPLAMLGHSGGVERQEDASPDAKKTCNARGRHGDHGSRTSPAYSRDSLPELIGQEGPATKN